jgi:hypothetical protein
MYPPFLKSKVSNRAPYDKSDQLCPAKAIAKETAINRYYFSISLEDTHIGNPIFLYFIQQTSYLNRLEP